MKSSCKPHANTSAKTWTPPELGDESAALTSGTQKEKILSVFRAEEEGTQEHEQTKSALHQKGTGKNITAWQPGVLGEQNESPRVDDWSFLEISGTPFDKAWRMQSPETTTKQGRLISDNEQAQMRERARRQAEEIILNAQAEADNILLQAQAEIDEQKQEGYRQGQAQAHAEVEGTVNAVRKMAQEVNGWKTELTSQGEQILTEMMKDLARKMFGDGVRLDPQALHTNLDRIMENASGLGELKVFLNPQDATLLDPSWKEQQFLILGEQVKIVPSANITRGGCLVKGSLGMVDARVETQLDSMLSAFDDPAAG